MGSYDSGVVDVADVRGTASDRFEAGDAADEDGSAYPYTVDPAETIKELGVEPGAEIVAEITTTGGDTFVVPVTGKVIWDRWDIDSVEFQDPDGTAARLIWWWAGE
jgi:hypothetical protein